MSLIRLKCGAVPFVTSEIEGKMYAVINVNTLEGFDPGRFDESPSDFDGEDRENRLDRRSRTWIPDVTLERHQ